MEPDLLEQRSQIVLCPIFTIDLEIKGAKMTPAAAEGEVDVQTDGHSFYVSSLEPQIQDAQKGQPTRPQARENRRRTLWGYVEDFREPRTKLGAFFSILLKPQRLGWGQDRFWVLFPNHWIGIDIDLNFIPVRIGDVEALADRVVAHA